MLSRTLKKILDISSEWTHELRRESFKQLFDELCEMLDVEVMEIKNEIRYIIYRHRYFVSSNWSISEENLVEYEELLNMIHINKPEYEYSYLFKIQHYCSLLHPVPYNREGKNNDNEMRDYIGNHQF